MESLINWKALSTLNRPQGGQAPDHNWNDTADYYNMMAEMERGYTYNQLNCFDTDPEDTVLDVGCGPGRITCIMAERAKRVTSIDAFSKMLGYCRSNADARGLKNVDTRLLDWHEAEPGKDLEQHDIVIASRSVGMHDLPKLNAFAKKYAVIIAWANAPSIPQILNELFAGTNPERDKNPRPMPPQDRRVGYNVFFNIAYDLGLDPNIRIVQDGFTKDFASHDEAYSWLRRLQPFEDRYLPVFRENLKPWLTENADGTVTFRRETRSFVLWWEPKPIQV